MLFLVCNLNSFAYQIEKNTTTIKAAEAATIDTWAIFNLLLDVPSFHSISSSECKQKACAYEFILQLINLYFSFDLGRSGGR